MKPSHFAVFSTAIIFSFIPVFASAATMEAAKTVSVPPEQAVADNAYLAGGQVVFLSTAQKDLAAAGGQVFVNGPVSGDALLAGGSVEVLQPVKGDLRVVGGQVTISGSVGGDVIAAGGTVIVLPGTVIGGDVLVAGGAVDMGGTVKGGLRVYGGEVTVNGTITGPVSLHARQVSFGDKAVIGSTLAYSAEKEATVATGAKLGDQVTYTKVEPSGMPRGGKAAGIFFGILGVLVLAKFIGMLAAALVMVLAFRTLSQVLVGRMFAHFWKKAGIGFLTLIAGPVAAILLFLTVIGSHVAIALILAYGLALFVASIYMCVFAGALLSRWIRKEAIVDWKWTILGTLAVFIVAFIPVIGWVADFVLFLASLGALVMSAKRSAEEAM